MTTSNQTILFIIGLCSWILGQLLWVLVGTQAYYIGVAIFITTLVGIIHMNTETGWKKQVSKIALFICVNNIFDELFFDPTLFSYNELITTLLIIFSTWINYKK